MILSISACTSGMGGVEVGLEIIEAVEVPEPWLRCRSSRSISARPETPCPHWRWPAFFRPDIPVTIFRIRVAARFLEPGMFVRGVVDHQIDQHADAALLGAVGELDEIAQRAVARVDGIIIGYIVSLVALRRYLKRHQPDRRDSQPVQVIEPAHQPGEIADAVAVGIHEAADRQAIDDRVLVPEVVDHLRRPRLRWRGKPGGDRLMTEAAREPISRPLRCGRAGRGCGRAGRPILPGCGPRALRGPGRRSAPIAAPRRLGARRRIRHGAPARCSRRKFPSAPRRRARRRPAPRPSRRSARPTAERSRRRSAARYI